MGRRRAFRRYGRKKNNNTSYFIIILICLVVFNVGTLLFRIGSNNKSVKEFNLVETIIDKLKLRDINIFTPNNSEDVNEAENNKNQDLDVEDETRSEEDYIISRLEEYESLIIVKDPTGKISTENIPNPLNIKKLSLNKENAYILMYHTHATESYLVDEEDVYHDSDISKNVVKIGETINKVLEANGHKVDHVQTLHDLPSYNKSYTRSLNTINNKKSANGNLKIFLDIHRDGVDKNATYKENFLKTARIDINGVSIATFSLVIGPDTPNYESVLSFAKYIKAVSDTMYPGLCTGIIIKPAGKYNLYASDYSALVEVGSNLVTREEAIESAKLIGEILSHALDRIIE